MAAFLEIVFQSKDWPRELGRDEIEDPLHDALVEHDLGEVTGGGSGSGVSIIDVDIIDSVRFQEALTLIKHVLKELNVPSSTVIKRHRPNEEIFFVFDP